MKCDTCGWRDSKTKYDSEGECFCCFEGQMVSEKSNITPRAHPNKHGA